MPVASESCNSKLGVNLVISFILSSKSSTEQLFGPDACIRNKHAKHQSPCHQFDNIPA